MDFENLSWNEVWAWLEAEESWQMEQGPRGKGWQTYFLPKGVTRGGRFRNRVDYFDSKSLVRRHLAGRLAGGASSGQLVKETDASKAALGARNLAGDAEPGAKPSRKRKLKISTDASKSAAPAAELLIKSTAVEEAVPVNSEAAVNSLEASPTPFTQDVEQTAAKATVAAAVSTDAAEDPERAAAPAKRARRAKGDMRTKRNPKEPKEPNPIVQAETKQVQEHEKHDSGKETEISAKQAESLEVQQHTSRGVGTEHLLVSSAAAGAAAVAPASSPCLPCEGGSAKTTRPEAAEVPASPKHQSGKEPQTPEVPVCPKHDSGTEPQSPTSRRVLEAEHASRTLGTEQLHFGIALAASPVASPRLLAVAQTPIKQTKLYQELSPQELELAEKVMSLKDRIDTFEATNTSSEADALAMLKELEDLGPLSLEILRATLVGKAVNALRKRVKNAAVRGSAHSLLLTWKDLAVGSLVHPDEMTEDCAVPLGGCAFSCAHLWSPLPSPIEASPPAKAPPTLAASPRTPAKRSFPTPDKQSLSPPSVAHPDAGQRASYTKVADAVKRRKVPTEQASHFLPLRRPPMSRKVVPQPAKPVVDGHAVAARVAADGLLKRLATNDFTLELDSGESVLLQCDLENGVTSLRNVCSMDGWRWVSDDKIAEAMAFWKALCDAKSRELPVAHDESIA